VPWATGWVPEPVLPGNDDWLVAEADAHARTGLRLSDRWDAGEDAGWRARRSGVRVVEAPGEEERAEDAAGAAVVVEQDDAGEFAGVVVAASFRE
jgi:hypothetical protein